METPGVSLRFSSKKQIKSKGTHGGAAYDAATETDGNVQSGADVPTNSAFSVVDMALSRSLGGGASVVL